jgi:hypothetical protein
MSLIAENLITKAIEIAGVMNIARVCGVRYQSVLDWEKRGRLPRTEWTGETNYSSEIEKITKGQITRKQLLNTKRKILTKA